MGGGFGCGVCVGGRGIHDLFRGVAQHALLLGGGAVDHGWRKEGEVWSGAEQILGGVGRRRESGKIRSVGSKIGIDSQCSDTVGGWHMECGYPEKTAHCNYGA